MRVLEIAGALGIETREEPLARDDLLAADEVFLTGSVRGIEPAASLDGHTAPRRRRDRRGGSRPGCAAPGPA